MKAGQRVKVTKLAALPNAAVATAKWEEYVPGQGATGGRVLSLPVDYTATGVLIADIVIGRGVTIDREERNGVQCPGFMHTTSVTEITPTSFKTRNSEYLIELAPSGANN